MNDEGKHPIFAALVLREQEGRVIRDSSERGAAWQFNAMDTRHGADGD